MTEIIEEILASCDMGSLPQEALRYSLDRASLSRGDGVLSIEMTLNFVLPIEARDRLAEQLSKSLGHEKEKIRFNFTSVSYTHLTLPTIA